MTNKVVLKYEDNLFKVCMNDKIIASDKDMDKMISRFKQVFKDNTANSSVESWENILSKVKRFDINNLEINEEYKTISFEKLKYFYASNNLFYLKNDSMVTLHGGYELCDFIFRVMSYGFIEYEKILEFCKLMIDNYVNYRTSDSSFIVSSPGFSYGHLEYDFHTKKIKKGIAIENGSFDDFASYVKENL